MPISVASLNQPPIFEGYVIRCASKNIHAKHMCLKEIGLCDENNTHCLGGTL